MSLVLFTGIPGSGKTLFAVSKLKKIVEKNVVAEEPRKIYADITGLAIEGIEKPPMDWRETPPNSLLIYDEAQFHKPFEVARGISPYDFIRELTIHRKTGHEIWYITQDPKRLHTNILEMIEQHFHLERPYGAKLATIYQFRGAERMPRSRSARDRAERKTIFHYDKSLFELYQSSEVDDGIRFRLPLGLIAWSLVAVGTIAITITLIFSDSTKKLLDPDSVTVTATAIPEAVKPKEKEVETVTTAIKTEVKEVKMTPEEYEEVRIAMVIKTPEGCIATNSRGDKLSLTYQECLDYSNKKKSMYFSKLDYTNKHSHNITQPVDITQTEVANNVTKGL